MTYKVKLHFFDGPLDLLLFLIKKERIDIYDIPISKVTEQYLAYLEMMEMLDLNVAGEFLVMAATLMHIKSKMLLPPEESLVEGEEEKDPREELVRRLLEYKKYKEAAGELLEMKQKARELFPRRLSGEPDKIVVNNEEYFEASLFDLISAFRKILKTVPKDVFHSVIKDKFTVSDKIHQIYHILAEKSIIYFSSLFYAAESKDEVIATFLAVLELIKMREIIVVQKQHFDEIEIIRNPEVSGGKVQEEEVSDYSGNKEIVEDAHDKEQVIDEEIQDMVGSAEVLEEDFDKINKNDVDNNDEISS